MDPIELLELCARGAREGAPSYINVPRLFSTGDYEALWRHEYKKVRSILDEILCGNFPQDGLELLLKSGALIAIIPEIGEIRNLGDDPVASMHKDVWEHTKLVVAGTPATLELRWSALMHDIGKARTRRVYNKKVTFHGHDVVGANMLDHIDKRVGLFRDDNKLFATVRSLVLNHLRPAAYKKTWADSGVRRLLTDLGGLQNFERLMQLSRADLTTKNTKKRNQCLARGEELVVRIKQIYAADNAPKLPKGTMGHILANSGRRPGAWVNNIRAKLEADMAIGKLPANQTLEYYAKLGLDMLDS